VPSGEASSKRARRAARVQTGLDVLEAQKFAPRRVKTRRLITNHTGLDSQGRSTADVLSHAAGVQLVALFSPEHGLAGRNDEKISSTKDPSTGLRLQPVRRHAAPKEGNAHKARPLVFDVQDAACGSYTYTGDMAYCMEEAPAQHCVFRSRSSQSIGT